MFPVLQRKIYININYAATLRCTRSSVTTKCLSLLTFEGVPYKGYPEGKLHWLHFSKIKIKKYTHFTISILYIK